jgi:alkanesulfonate monooxygenase
MLEGYSALSYLAAVTERPRLGTMVTAVVYRHPGALIKTVSTLDVLSKGRAWLGIGAAWFEREALGLGLPFPSLKKRFERLEETLQIAHLMWSGQSGSFAGKHYQLAEALNQPQPLSRPHPPILIGGAGEQKTLRLVAQYGDACNLFPSDNQMLAHKLDVLKGHCEAVGREYGEIERTLLVPLRRFGGLDIPALVEHSREWAKLDIQHIILSSVPEIETITPLEMIGRELIPRLAEM